MYPPGAFGIVSCIISSRFCFIFGSLCLVLFMLKGLEKQADIIRVNWVARGSGMASAAEVPAFLLFVCIIFCLVNVIYTLA